MLIHTMAAFAGPTVRILFPPAESLQTFGSSRAATATAMAQLVTLGLASHYSSPRIGPAHTDLCRDFFSRAVALELSFFEAAYTALSSPEDLGPAWRNKRQLGDSRLQQIKRPRRQ
jgi:hypothetical protein